MVAMYVKLEIALRHLFSEIKNEEGQDLIEYALLAGLIALVAVGTIGVAGDNLTDLFQAIADMVADVGP